MENGTCFIYDQSSDIYINLPDLTCTDGSPLPLFDTTTGKTYQKRDGSLVLIRTETVSYSDLHNYVGYNYYLGKIPFYDVNIVLLVVSAFVISLFMIIYRWFFRLRA